MAAPARRGLCPGLSNPMMTGDGLLARLPPTGRLALEAFAALCRTAERFGNDIVEVTARGSLQVRGLTAETAPAFAKAVAALGIADQAGPPVLTNPLAGLDPSEVMDTRGLAAALRERLARFAGRVAPKVSMVVDGGGSLNLDPLAADIRLTAASATGGARLHITVGGDAATAVPIGAVDPDDAVGAATAAIEVIAANGPASRARDVLRRSGPRAFADAMRPRLVDQPPPSSRMGADAVGTHPLRGGKVAVGFGLPFGQSEAGVLVQLVEAARDAGAETVVPVHGRVLLVVGLAEMDVPALVAVADGLGYIVRSDDPRRAVIACPGAPFCASAEIPTRRIAPAVVRALGPVLDGSLQVHLSGCAKGCAAPAVDALTIVGAGGRCGIIPRGRATDLPSVLVPVEGLSDRLAQLAAQVNDARRPGESSAEVLARMGLAMREPELAHE